MSIDHNVASQIQATLNPFLTYATTDNPSGRCNPCVDSDCNVQVLLIYQKCVSCNLERFKAEYINQFRQPTLSEFRVEEDTLLCEPCGEKVQSAVYEYIKTAKTVDRCLIHTIDAVLQACAWRNAEELGTYVTT